MCKSVNILVFSNVVQGFNVHLDSKRVSIFNTVSFVNITNVVPSLFKMLYLPCFKV